MSEYALIARRITRTLFLAQSLGSAGLIAATTVNAIVGAALSGQAAWAGLPTAIYLLGGAAAALGWGFTMDHLGRRRGLVMGLLLGSIGAGLTGSAVISRSFGVFLIGLMLMGTASSAMQFGRFAAAEVHPQQERGRAISKVVVGGTVGAVFGPLLVGPTGQWAQGWGLDELSGPYGITLLMFFLSAIAVFTWLKPDPRDVGRTIAGFYPDQPQPGTHIRPLRIILRDPTTVVAMTAMIVGQLTMWLLMVATTLQVRDHQHSLDAVSLVMSLHTLGMYAFSMFSGRLADRWGRVLVISVGAGLLILASLAASVSSQVLPISIALFLVGLGWNFCYVGGSSLLTDQLSPFERARTQGVNDLLIALVSAAGSLGSGIAYARVGFGAMSLISAMIAMFLLGLILWWKMRHSPSKREQLNELI